MGRAAAAVKVAPCHVTEYPQKEGHDNPVGPMKALYLIACVFVAVAQVPPAALAAEAVPLPSITEPVSQGTSNGTPRDQSQSGAHPTTHLFVPPAGAVIPLPPGLRCRADAHACEEAK